jgi:hypothetical protein
MYPHFEKKSNDLRKYIIDNKVNIIHLVRRNKLAHLISSKTKKDKSVKLDINKIKSEMDKAEKRNKKINDLFFTKIPYIEIYYEDMFGKTEGDKENVQKYGAFNIKSDQITYLSDFYKDKICEFLYSQYQEIHIFYPYKNQISMLFNLILY